MTLCMVNSSDGVAHIDPCNAVLNRKVGDADQ